MNTIKIKRSQITSTPASLLEGELAYSELSGNLFIGKSGDNIDIIGGKTVVDSIDTKVPLNGNATIHDVKTFTEFPLLPTTTVSTNYQAIPKKYVDDAIAALSIGNMFKGTYDANDNGIVDNSERLGNQLPSYYAKMSDIANSANWNTAYAHSQLTAGNPHDISYADLNGSQPAPIAHNHEISEVTGLQTELDGKKNDFTENTAFNKSFGSGSDQVPRGNHVHDDRYYTETEVDALISAATRGMAYKWADEAERLAQTGMVHQDQGLQDDTRMVYIFSDPDGDGAGTWLEFYALDSTHTHNITEVSGLQGELTGLSDRIDPLESHSASKSNPHETSDVNLVVADNTSNNVSTTKHGFAPKGNGNAESFLNGAGTYSTPAGAGNVTAVNSPVNNDFAKFTNATDIEGRSYAQVRSDLDLVAGTDFYGKSAEDTWRNGVDQTEMGYLNGVTAQVLDANATIDGGTF